MAWQTPKTDWAAGDGVRDSDFNRIEGNILELYTTTKLPSASIIYVSPAPSQSGLGGGIGSDTTGNGTSSAPYATITKALSTLPKDLNGKTVSINVAAGTYNETVVVTGFNGLIEITGSYGAQVILTGLKVDSAVCRVSSISIFPREGGVVVTNGGVLICSSSVSVTGASIGVHADRGSKCIIDASLSVSNASSVAVNAQRCSDIYVLQLTVSNSPVILQAEHGSTIAYSSTNLTVTGTTFVTRTGGRIYSGAQTSVPTY